MRILLDTHVVLWWLTDSASLAPAARTTIDDAVAGDGVFVSAMSVLEIAGLAGRGNLPPAADFVRDAAASGFRLLPFEAQDGLVVAALPRVHGDPVDRALAAQAHRRQLTLMTADARLAEYPIAVFRL
ncbi:MAG: type II toxin-antitoxin system VapC family toxin [Gaiellales bacterium]